MKFKSDIEVQAGLKDNSDSSGASGQVLSSTANGVSWTSPSSEKTHIPVKNTSGATIEKGTPVYITGETGNSGKIEVAHADAGDSAKMPAVGILESTLTNNSEGFCISGGLLEGLSTETIDGTTTTANDTVYVKSGGGLTMTKPTGSDNLIQNIAKIARTHASNGSLIVSSILRTNDVPNLPTGRIWVGDGNTIVSDTVYVDEPNNRVGIGTASPAYQLTLGGNAVGSTEGLRINDPSNAAYGAHFSFSDTPNEVWIGGVTNNTYNSAIGIHREATRAITIDVDSNVGIGTTSPENKLHVQQSALYTGIQTTAGIRIKSDGASAVGNYHGTIALSRGTGSVAISAVQEASDSDVMGMAFFTHPSTTGGDAAVEQMRIDQNGNVGIGTTSPLNKTHIVGPTLITGTETTYGLAVSDIGDETKTLILGYDLVNDVGIIQAIDQQTAWKNLAFAISGDTGVGIGTTSPAAKLEVKKSSYNAGNAIANFVNGNDPLRVAYDTVVIAQTDVPTLSIVETIDGSQANEQKLTFSVGDNKAVIASTSTATGGMYFNVNRDVDAPGYNTGNGITALKISNNGNVGIGTTSPNSKLEVSSYGARGILISKDTAVPSNSGRLFFETDTVSEGFSFLNSNGLMTIRSQAQAGATSGNTRVAINGSGYVGIGTSSPSEKLDVNGNVKIKDALLSNQENTDIDSAAAEVVAQVSITDYTAAFFDFVVKKGTNIRSGTVYACHDGTNVEFTETSTNDLGDTSDVTLSVDKTSTNLRLIATVTSDDWSVKSLIRAI